MIRSSLESKLYILQRDRQPVLLITCPLNPQQIVPDLPGPVLPQRWFWLF